MQYSGQRYARFDHTLRRVVISILRRTDAARLLLRLRQILRLLLLKLFAVGNTAAVTTLGNTEAVAAEGFPAAAAADVVNNLAIVSAVDKITAATAAGGLCRCTYGDSQTSTAFAASIPPFTLSDSS